MTLVKNQNTENQYNKYINDLSQGILPERNWLLNVISSVQTILQNEPNIIPVTGDVFVVGDLHGQYFDFLNMLDIIKQTTQNKDNNNRKLMFLGDYVDRGCHSVELIVHLLLLKLSCPKDVLLLRGNHENRAQTAVYGFMDECQFKYDAYVYWRICDLFAYLPMASVINDQYLCIHGGIVPDIDLDDIICSDRISEYSHIGPVLWSDPSDDIQDYGNSERGAGCLFGATALTNFLRREKLNYLIRSHQLVMDGARTQFSGQCITVWSAPNYCYKCKNMAAILQITRDTHKLIFYEACNNQKGEKRK